MRNFFKLNRKDNKMPKNPNAHLSFGEGEIEMFAPHLEKELKEVDHFYIVHYCKKREQIEERRCYFDSKSRIWETKKGKLAFTCVATKDDENGDPMISGYRTFTDIFQIKGYVSKSPSTTEVQ